MSSRSASACIEECRWPLKLLKITSYKKTHGVTLISIKSRLPYIHRLVMSLAWFQVSIRRPLEREVNCVVGTVDSLCKNLFLIFPFFQLVLVCRSRFDSHLLHSPHYVVGTVQLVWKVAN
jgi:hypothetical protein